MDKIDKTGFTTFTTLQILQIPIIKAAMLSLLQEVTHSKVLFMPYNRHRIYSRNMMGETTRWGSWYDATKGVVIPGSNPVV